MLEDMSKKQYCYLEPIFPKEGFVVLVFIFKDDTIIGLEALSKLFLSPYEASEQIKKEIIQMVDSKEEITATIAPDGVIIPVHFLSLYPLRREYWENPVVHYDIVDRTRLFNEVMKATTEYQLLVTPQYVDEEGIQFLDVAFPFDDIETMKSVEMFMRTSDQVVDQRAKSAAIYTFGKKQKFNWMSGIVKDVEYQEKN